MRCKYTTIFYTSKSYGKKNQTFFHQNQKPPEFQHYKTIKKMNFFFLLFESFPFGGNNSSFFLPQDDANSIFSPLFCSFSILFCSFFSILPLIILLFGVAIYLFRCFKNKIEQKKTAVNQISLLFFYLFNRKRLLIKLH